MKSLKIRIPAIALFAFLALAAGLPGIAAQETNQPSAKSPSASNGGKKPIEFSARSVQGVLAKGKENTILSGSVKILTGSLEIHADRVELSGTDYNNVYCVGNVSVTDSEKGFSMTAQKLRYVRDTEIGIAQGKVVVDDAKNKTVINAEWVRFDQVQSVFEAAVSVLVLKEDMSIRAEYAFYNRDTEEIKLHGGAVAITEEGTLTGDVITATADWSDLKISGQVGGIITPKKEESSDR